MGPSSNVRCAHPVVSREAGPTRRTRGSSPPSVRLVAIALGALVACDPGEGTSLDARGRATAHPYAPGIGSRFGTSLSEPTYEAIALEFLEPFCAECHTGATASKGLELTYEVAYEELVGVPAVQSSGTDLVEPGAPDASYLVIKLEGGPTLVGRRMPRGRPTRPQDEIDVIRAWIERGAPRDG